MITITDKKFINFCKKNGIKFEKDNDEFYEFTAPKGFVFGNDSKYRILEVSDSDLQDLEIFSA
jgi:hypothetical protein